MDTPGVGYVSSVSCLSSVPRRQELPPFLCREQRAGFVASTGIVSHRRQGAGVVPADQADLFVAELAGLIEQVELNLGQGDIQAEMCDQRKISLFKNPASQRLHVVQPLQALIDMVM